MFNGNTSSFMITKKTACTQWFSTLSVCYSNGGKLLSAETHQAVVASLKLQQPSQSATAAYSLKATLEGG